MGRDWECHLYYPHQPLTAALAGNLLTALSRLQLAPHLTADAARGYPTMAAIVSGATGVRFTTSDTDTEVLLRAKPPPLGSGYGVIALRAAAFAEPGADVFLSFGRVDPAIGLDSLSLTVDGAIFAGPDGTTNPAAFAAVFTWFAVLAEQLAATYGWGDWEDVWFSVALPSRTQAAKGEVQTLFRLNCFGPTLVEQIGRSRFASLPARVEELAHGAIVVGAGLAYQDRTTEQRATAAAALGLRPAGGWT